MVGLSTLYTLAFPSSFILFILSNLLISQAYIIVRAGTSIRAGVVIEAGVVVRASIIISSVCGGLWGRDLISRTLFEAVGGVAVAVAVISRRAAESVIVFHRFPTGDQHVNPRL